jgi:thiol-disulfide isomerase/thioredoxin
MKKNLLSIALLLGNCHLVYAVEEGQIPPVCTVQMQARQAGLKLNDYKGKVVLIDFWATWCGPCQKSMPFFNSLRNERQKDGFEIIAINIDEDQEIARQFLLSHPVDYPTAFDPGGECPKSYQVKAMPSSYLIDKTGKVRYIHLGYRDSDQAVLREHIQTLLVE